MTKACPICGGEFPNRVYILRLLHAMGLTVIASNDNEITITVPSEELVEWDDVKPE